MHGFLPSGLYLLRLPRALSLAVSFMKRGLEGLQDHYCNELANFLCSMGLFTGVHPSRKLSFYVFYNCNGVALCVRSGGYDTGIQKLSALHPSSWIFLGLSSCCNCRTIIGQECPLAAIQQRTEMLKPVCKLSRGS